MASGDIYRCAHLSLSVYNRLDASKESVTSFSIFLFRHLGKTITGGPPAGRYLRTDGLLKDGETKDYLYVGAAQDKVTLKAQYVVPATRGLSMKTKQRKSVECCRAGSTGGINTKSHTGFSSDLELFTDGRRAKRLCINFLLAKSVTAKSLIRIYVSFGATFYLLRFIFPFCLPGKHRGLAFNSCFVVTCLLPVKNSTKYAGNIKRSP